MDKKEKYLEFDKSEREKNNIRKLIEGCLNRISITDDEDERFNRIAYIMKYTLEYYDLSKKSHALFEELFNYGKENV